MKTKLEGTLVSWSLSANCGVIAVKSKDSPTISRYFLLLSGVSYCEPLSPHAGCKIVFDESARALRRPTDLPYAENAKVYPATNPADVLSGVKS